MSGFKDTFTKEDDSLLGYDDTAFYYFACSVVFVIAVPWTYSVFKNFFFAHNAKGFPNRTADGKEYRYCKSSAMVSKIEDARREANRWTTNGTVNFVFKVIFLVFVWSCLIFVTQYCASQKEIKAFDPFEILQVAPEAETSDIKKAYRKLSLIYHPDKNQGDPIAQSKFIQITKAYEALTDEAARENYEKYGNPDGQTTTKVGIGLPSFLLEKDNHVLILSAFFFVLLILVPTVGICYYNKISGFMPSGIMVETHQMYIHLLADGKRLKDMPELLAISAEARKMVLQTGPADDKRLKKIRQDVDYKDTKLQIRVENFVRVPLSTILTLGHMYRLQPDFSPAMQADVDYLLKRSMKITQEMMDIVKEKSQLTWDPRYHHLGTAWLGVAQGIISFRRCLVQAVSGAEKECELLQIPHFTEDVLKHCKKGKQSKQVSSLTDFLSKAPEDRKGMKEMTNHQLADMEAFCDHISKMEIKASIGVEGETDGSICMYDTATVTVELTRTNLEKGQAMGPAHAPYFPEPKFEEWWIFVTEVNSMKIIAMEKVRDPSWRVEAKLQVYVWDPFIPKAGKYKFEVHALCDSYLGVDCKQFLEFTVTKSEEADRQVFVHPEDEDLDNQPTLFQQITGLHNEVESDEEEEDDEKEKKPTSKTKKSKDEDSSSSSSEDEKDEKDKKVKKDEAEEDEGSERDKEAKEDGEKEKPKEPKKTKKKNEKKDDDSNASSSDSDSDSDEDVAPKKTTGPCSGCVLC